MFVRDTLAGGGDRDKLDVLRRAEGPHDLWRAAEDQVAVAWNPFCMCACIDAGAGERFLKLWFQGIGLEPAGTPPRVIREASPSARDQPGVVATELDRLAAMGAADWYPRECRPP